jgi:RNA-directed DNA polymerase
MKRYGHLFEKAFTRESLLNAYYAASKGKHSKRACFVFERNLGANLAQLHSELHSGRYTPRPYYSFIVYEPKPRMIYAPAFRDRVVQHAIYNVIMPIFDKSFIAQSYACRVGKGTHKAADYAQQALKQGSTCSYTLKLDIRKFFYRIDREILRKLLVRKIKDQRMLSLLMLIADHGEPLGIPIGSLLSQVYALVYLNPLDHFIKRELKIKKYCRYVDDFILFGLTREAALFCKQEIIDFIKRELNLELSRATLARTNKGVNFVGYRTWRRKRFIRKRSLYNLRRAVKKQRLSSIISILGHACKTHTLRYLINYIQDHNYAIYLQLPKTYQFNNH